MNIKQFKINAIFKSGMRPVNIIRPFVLANVGLFVIVTVLLLRPAALSWSNARDFIGRQRHVYAAYAAQARDYHALQIAYLTPSVLPYTYLAAALNDVQNLARFYGLETIEFRASEPVGYDAVSGERFVEIRVIASFTGLEYKATQFIYCLAESAAFIRNLRMDILDDEVNLRIEFSLFGGGE